MDTYNNYDNKEVIVKDSLIGQGEKFEKRMASFSFYTYFILIVLSFSIPYLFLDWFYDFKFWSQLKFIKNIILINYSGKWQYINFYSNHQYIHSATMLAVYFYIVSFVLLLIVSLKIAKIFIKYKRESILNAEAKYKNEIEMRQKNK